MYGLKGIEKLLKEMEARRQKMEAKAYNKKVGYAPKCKVCNSTHLDEIEKLRENGYTYEEIVQELNITDISIMSLSRHFKNHYPKSQAYKNKQKIEMLENIREAYIKHPFLEDYFKNKDLTYLEIFNKEYGFCTDKFSLCEQIPASTVSNSCMNINHLQVQNERELQQKNTGYFGLDQEERNSINLKYLDLVTDCLQCKDSINENRINLLEKIITYNFLNISPENKELYFNLLEFDGNPEEFIQTLTEAKEETQPAK